jgi:hypothetical protein
MRHKLYGDPSEGWSQGGLAMNGQYHWIPRENVLCVVEPDGGWLIDWEDLTLTEGTAVDVDAAMDWCELTYFISEGKELRFAIVGDDAGGYMPEQTEPEDAEVGIQGLLESLPAQVEQPVLVILNPEYAHALRKQLMPESGAVGQLLQLTGVPVLVTPLVKTYRFVGAEELRLWLLPYTTIMGARMK